MHCTALHCTLQNEDNKQNEIEKKIFRTEVQLNQKIRTENFERKTEKVVKR